MTRDPVDAVITWVDGNDKAHSDKRTNYLANTDAVNPEASAPTRFNQSGEITYCVKSLLRFAPWLKTIHIVTDAQTPSIFRQFAGTPLEERVRIVDHREIFLGFEQYLPTFNSLTIETMLWRIKDVANNFIYFNDDVSIIRPIAYDDFFQGDKIVLRGQWKAMTDRKLYNYWKKCLKFILKNVQHSAKRELYQIVQENSAKLVGWTEKYFSLPHVPLPVKKQTFEDFFKIHPDMLLNNIRYAFRNNQQFMPLLLAQNLEIIKDNVVFDNRLKATYVNGACHAARKIQRRLASADRTDNAAFVCMQSIDLAPEPVQKLLFEWLKKRIG